MDVALHKEQDDTLATVVHSKDTNIAKSASKNITRQRSPKGKEKETQIDRNGGADRFTTLSTIHEELLVHICRYLTPASILRLARTSSYFYHITAETWLWKELYLRRWSKKQQTNTTDSALPFNWKEEYKRRELNVREKKIIFSLLPFFLSNNRGLYKKPDLPESKLVRAMKACQVADSPALRKKQRGNALSPPTFPLDASIGDYDETIIMLDCTLFGSASWAILLGLKGIHFNTGNGPGYIPYTAFLGRPLPHGNTEQSYYGGEFKTLLICDHQLNVSACAVAHQDLCTMLLTLRNVLLEGCEKDTRLVGCPSKQPKQAKEQPVDSIRESREADYFDDDEEEEEEQIPEICIKRKDFLAIVAGYLPLQQFTALPKEHKNHHHYLMALGVPPTERIYMLLDTTFFGVGSCGVAFGSQGIYYCNSSFSQLQPGVHGYKWGMVFHQLQPQFGHIVANHHVLLCHGRAIQCSPGTKKELQTLLLAIKDFVLPSS